MQIFCVLVRVNGRPKRIKASRTFTLTYTGGRERLDKTISVYERKRKRKCAEGALNVNFITFYLFGACAEVLNVPIRIQKTVKCNQCDVYTRVNFLTRPQPVV